jgi:hypothetical protein
MNRRYRAGAFPGLYKAEDGAGEKYCQQKCLFHGTKLRGGKEGDDVYSMGFDGELVPLPYLWYAPTLTRPVFAILMVLPSPVNEARFAL